MTATYKVVNTSGTEGDEIHIKQSGFETTVLRRGETTALTGVTTSGHMVHISGKHGDGAHLGPVEVVTNDT